MLLMVPFMGLDVDVDVGEVWEIVFIAEVEMGDSVLVGASISLSFPSSLRNSCISSAPRAN
jgi:hypothetical protein